MKIQLKHDAKPVKRRPYHLNPIYKEIVQKELNRMLDTKIIVHVKESDWISPMVIQLGEILICVDLQSLNTSYIHDPFPIPFIDKVLENVGGMEVYSFMDGFSRYHQVQIIEED
jgi:hypothetical protein